MGQCCRIGWSGRELETGSPVNQSRQEMARIAVAAVGRGMLWDEELSAVGEEVSQG